MDGKRIRAFYANATAWSFDSDAEPHIVALREKQASEFDAWLDRGLAVARREGQAEAWENAVEEAADRGWLHVDAVADISDRNPYRNGEDR